MSDSKKECDLYSPNEKEDQADNDEMKNLMFYHHCQKLVEESSYPEPAHENFISKYEEYLVFRENSARDSFAKDIAESRLAILNKILKGYK